ncbi:glycosyltransferase [Clostridium malenominatum]|uniref:cellulose synthase (UDP-forming) n=1 Tax=Clostridium malenominatum TaxID=1539 RepID=A0ABN1J120_9CLOT
MGKSIKSRRKSLLIAASISSLIYITWRIVFTIPTEHGLVSMIAGIALIASESIGAIEAFSHYRNMSFAKEPEKPEIPLELYPDIDVFIATHSESTELLYKTVNGCTHMRYPDLTKVHIYICDDSDRLEMKQLAENMGVGYFGMVNNKLAKAGNLNNALNNTKSPLVVTFDADMIPTHDFLMETVPYFFLPLMKKDEEGNWIKRTESEIDKDYKIGFIQTPQSFYNADLFQYNLFSEKNIPNEQDYFFREVNVGRNRTNSPIYAGSNTIISRDALNDVGGITTGTITEDFATGIEIQSKGYKCFAISKVVAHGLAPNDFKSLIKQRQRWGRGCVQTLRKSNFIFSKLPLRSKFSYLLCLLYWWTFMRRFIYIISPILFTVFGIVVVECSLLELVVIWLPSYLVYNKALKVMSGNIRNQKWNNIVDTIIFPYMIIPVFAETIGLRLNKFAVTPKDKPITKNSEVRYAIPHIMLSVATIIGLWSCVKNTILYHSMGNIILIYWLVVNLYFLLMAILFMLGRVNYRKEERYYAQVDAKISTLYNVFHGITSDISEGGLAVVLNSPEYIPYDTDIDIEVNYLEYHAEFKGRVRHVTNINNKWKYSIKITDISEENKRSYYQIVFDRDHTLPTTIKSGTVKEIRGNIRGRTKSTIVSNRKLPRIPLNVELNTVDGNTVRVVNYNYEYILLETTNIMGNDIQLDLGEGLIVKCVPDTHNPFMDKVLCHIENWKEVIGDKRFHERLCKWLDLSEDTDDKCLKS